MNSYAATSFARRAGRVATPAMGQIRHLRVHEYISMEIMNQHRIATPRGFVAKTPEEAEHIFTTMMNKPGQPLKDVVIKAQVLSGGRGLGTLPSRMGSEEVYTW